MAVTGLVFERGFPRYTAAMPYLIGTDEAGYGPNLGPLVISATVWHVDAPSVCDLYERLCAIVSPGLPTARQQSVAKMTGTAGKKGKQPAQSKTAQRSQRKTVTKSINQTANDSTLPARGSHSAISATAAGQLAIADSKLLYKAGDGMAQLERGVLAMLRLLGCRPRIWGDVFEHLLDAASREELDWLPWHRDYQLAVPIDADGADLDHLAERIPHGMAAAGVRLVSMRSTAVFPARFNRLTQQCGSKGEVLSRLTLELIAAALPACNDGPVFVTCDKHGGRNYYGSLLQQQFPDPLIEVHGESTDVSIYRWTHDAQRVEVRFQAKGETWLPAALASMVSKYLRELAMRAFNDYWCGHVPELRRTAGYPGDALRFKKDIAAKQTTLGIEDHLVWRER